MTDKETPEAKQPEPLRLAALLNEGALLLKAASSELCRQHSRISELGAELEAVGAGGVQALSAGPGASRAAPPSTYVNGAGIHAEDGAATVIRKLDARFHDLVTFKAVDAATASPTPPAEQQDLSKLTERGAVAWAGVDAQALRDGTYQPGAVYAEMPDLIGTEINDACWAFVKAMPHDLPGPIWNDLKPAVHAAICRFLQAAPKAAPGEPIDRAAFFEWWGPYQLPDYWASRIDVVAWHAWQAAMTHAATKAAPQQEAQERYSIDADPQGIRAIVADAITGALAFGAQGSSPPPEGHWLTPFWEMAREEAMRTRPALVSSDTLYLLRRLLSNQHTLTGPEFRAELEKIVGEAYQQQEAQEPVAWYFKSPARPGEQPLIKKLDWKPHNKNWRPLAELAGVERATAPQPAPAPLSEQATQAARWRLVETAPSNVTLRLHNLRPDQRAQYIDAALAAKKGTP